MTPQYQSTQVQFVGPAIDPHLACAVMAACTVMGECGGIPVDVDGSIARGAARFGESMRWLDERTRTEEIARLVGIGVAAGAHEVKVPASPKRRDDATRAVAIQIAAGADWIDQYASPLGKRKHLRLCREGVLPFRADGKQRLVRRADLDAYITANGEPGRAADKGEIDRELEAIGLGGTR